MFQKIETYARAVYKNIIRPARPRGLLAWAGCGARAKGDNDRAARKSELLRARESSGLRVSKQRTGVCAVEQE
jgi:hypothetical protein